MLCFFIGHYDLPWNNGFQSLRYFLFHAIILVMSQLNDSLSFSLIRPLFSVGVHMFSPSFSFFLYVSLAFCCLTHTNTFSVEFLTIILPFITLQLMVYLSTYNSLVSHMPFLSFILLTAHLLSPFPLKLLSRFMSFCKSLIHSLFITLPSLFLHPHPFTVCTSLHSSLLPPTLSHFLLVPSCSFPPECSLSSILP